MMVYPMVRKDLEQQAKEGMKNETCESCGESWKAHLNTIGQNCHPGIGLLVGFHPNSGCLVLSCPACKESFGMIQVAKETDDIFEGIPKAPQEYWDLYNDASGPQDRHRSTTIGSKTLPTLEFAMV